MKAIATNKYIYVAMTTADKNDTKVQHWLFYKGFDNKIILTPILNKDIAETQKKLLDNDGIEMNLENITFFIDNPDYRKIAKLPMSDLLKIFDVLMAYKRYLQRNIKYKASSDGLVLYDKRRCGNTTRIVDNAVQHLFAGFTVGMFDYAPESTDKAAKERLNRMMLHRVVRRIYNEHSKHIVLELKQMPIITVAIIYPEKQ